MNKSKIIDYIYIQNLHGYKNVKIDFDSPFLILLSENGQGKSTILRIIKSCLNLELQNLENIKFEKIIIKFTITGDEAVLRKEDIDYEFRSHAYEYIKMRLPKSEFNELIRLMKNNFKDEYIIEYFKKNQLYKKYNIPIEAVKELIYDQQ